MGWYVVQVRRGYEKEMAEKCKILLSKDVLIDCFIPKYIVKRRRFGEWSDVTEILFKGYIFVITNKIDELFNALKMIPDFTKVIGKKNNEIFSLMHNEVLFLKSFIDEDYTLKMSIGIIEGNSIHIIKGPLLGKEGIISKIDRHKRIAYINVDMFDELATMKLGLEIICRN